MEGIIEILKLAWHGHEIEGLIRLVEPVSTAIAIGSAAASLLGTLFGTTSANKRASSIRKKQTAYYKSL